MKQEETRLRDETRKKKKEETLIDKNKQTKKKKWDMKRVHETIVDVKRINETRIEKTNKKRKQDKNIKWEETRHEKKTRDKTWREENKWD